MNGSGCVVSDLRLHHFVPKSKKNPSHHVPLFWDPEGGFQKATQVVLVVVISSLKIPKAFLIRSGAQRNFAYTFVLTLHTDLLSQIFHLCSN